MGQFRELLPDMNAVFSSAHLRTLRTRQLMAHYVGEAGQVPRRCACSRSCCPTSKRCSARNIRTSCAPSMRLPTGQGRAGRRPRRCSQFEALLPKAENVLGRKHPEMLGIRHEVAHWTGQAGQVSEALRLFGRCCPTSKRCSAPRHPDTLRTRQRIGYYTGHAGQVAEALRLFQELLPDQQEVLGAAHPYFLLTRHEIAHWTGEAGAVKEAVGQFRELLPDMNAVFSSGHLRTLRTRQRMAHYVGEAGQVPEALRQFQALLPDQQKVLGPKHPHVLRTEYEIAYWTGGSGKEAEALRQFEALLPNAENVLGRKHPETLGIRHEVAHWTGQAGQVSRGAAPVRGAAARPARGARRRDIRTHCAPGSGSGTSPAVRGRWPRRCACSRSCCPTSKRCSARHIRMSCSPGMRLPTGRVRRAPSTEAVGQFRELLPEMNAVFSPAHLRTLRTRQLMAHYIGEAGQVAEALRLFQALLPDQQKVLGPNIRTSGAPSMRLPTGRTRSDTDPRLAILAAYVLAAIQGVRRWRGCVFAGERVFRGGSGCGGVACDDTVSVSDLGRPSPWSFWRSSGRAVGVRGGTIAHGRQQRAAVEELLGNGLLSCPGCGGRLGGWGHAVRRQVFAAGRVPVSVRPRRARCSSCGATQCSSSGVAAGRSLRWDGGDRGHARAGGPRPGVPVDRGRVRGAGGDGPGPAAPVPVLGGQGPVALHPAGGRACGGPGAAGAGGQRRRGRGGGGRRGGGCGRGPVAGAHGVGLGARGRGHDGVAPVPVRRLLPGSRGHAAACPGVTVQRGFPSAPGALPPVTLGGPAGAGSREGTRCDDCG